MTIVQQDLKLLKAQDQTDTDDGGGLPSGQVVIDGQSNNLFPDVSDIDAVNGRVRLRKLFLSVESDNAEPLLAARLLVTAIPQNPNVSVFVFKPTYWADRRKDAQDKLEQYLARGVKISGHLLETQLEGQRAIQQVMRTTDVLPAVGDALVLTQNEGLGNEYSQFVRVTKITTQQRTFAINTSSDVVRLVVTFEISEPLRFEFNGMTVADFERNTYNTSTSAYLRDARVADANKFYSAARLMVPITALETNQVQLTSIYTNVVPSTQSPQTLAQLDPANLSTVLAPASDGTTNYTATFNVTSGFRSYVGSPFMPGSLNTTLDGQIATDRGGVLKGTNGTIYANLEYSTGSIVWATGVTLGNRSLTLNFVPAGVSSRLLRSEALQVPETNGGFNYIRTLEFSPAKGSVQVSYEVNQRVYLLQDDGIGGLASIDGSGGAGSIDYESGTVSITTGAIPDSLSLIIISYGSAINLKSVPNQALSKAYLLTNLNNQGLDLLTASFSWADGTKTATSTNRGVISGDATGSIAASDARLKLEFESLPVVGSDLTATYEYGQTTTELITATATTEKNSGVITIPGTGPLSEGTVIVSFPVVIDDGRGGVFDTEMKARDNALGDLELDFFSATLFGDRSLSGTVVGSVDYANRTISLSLNLSIDYEASVRVNYPDQPTYVTRYRGV